MPLPPQCTPLLLSPGTGHNSHTQGAILILSKYIAMLHEHVTKVIPTALLLAQVSRDHFSLVATSLQKGPSGVLLPELAVGLVLLQLRMPLLLQDSKCVPLLGELVTQLDGFNRQGPGAGVEDEDDLAWPGVRSE